MQHFRTLLDVTPDQLRQLLEEAARLKVGWQRGERPALLARRVLGLVFEKPSLRTRVSFEAAMAQLGGSSIFLSEADGGMGRREPVPDFARVLSQYVDVVALRVFSQKTVEEFAACSSCPVINALSDLDHPCQALGDLMTMQEQFGKVAGRTLVFVGDGNNVARSLALGCGMLGVRFILSAPEGYRFDAAFEKLFHTSCPQGELLQEGDPVRAVAKADVLYTDVWTSMGQEAERQERLQRFANYQVNAQLLARAPAHARVMHCLPARRGEEITADVFEGPQSLVIPQAANRLHAQKSLLCWLVQS